MDIRVVVLLALSAYGIVRYVETRPMDCPLMPVSCLCDKKIEYKTIETRLLRDEDYGGVVCSTVKNPFHVCESYDCEFSDPGMETLQKDYNVTGNYSMFYPVGYVFSSEQSDLDQDHRNTRRARPSKPCHMKPLYSADVACWNWGYFYACNVTCIPGYGHTVDNRSVRSWNTKCRYSEDFWYPREYDNCEPVGRNCDVELTGSGTLICTGPTEEHRYCDIECFADIFRETGNLTFARYACESDNYAHELPWCASLRNVSVIEEPDYPMEDVYHYTGPGSY